MVRLSKCAFLCEPLCPRWLKLSAAFISVAGVMVTTACRLDMHVQPRQNPLSYSDFYADHRSARAPVEGTVARGQLNADTYFYTGKIVNNPGEEMPFPATATALFHLADSRASPRPITSLACRKRP